jgi:uncharacterized protein
MPTGVSEAESSSIHALARRATPWGFPVLYLGWAYLFWIPIVLSGEPVWAFPTVIPFVIGGLSPLLAGLVLLWLTQGREGFRDLRNRLTEIGRVSVHWWLVILLFFPMFNLFVAGVALALGVTSSPLEFITEHRLFDPGAVTLLLLVALIIPVIEEVGLRGYWFDQLQARWSALVASLILGVVWAAWHAPLVYMTDYFEGTTFQPKLWWWLPSIVLLAIIGTWIYNNTHRSVLALIAFHFAGNLTGETIGFSGEMYPYVHLGTTVVAVLIVVRWGPESLRGWDEPRPIVKREVRST